MLINGSVSLARLATAAADSARCQFTSVTGLKPALSLVAKKQFDLILMDASSLGDADLGCFLATDLTRQGDIVIEGSTGAPRGNHGKRARAEYLTEPLSLGCWAG